LEDRNQKIFRARYFHGNLFCERVHFNFLFNFIEFQVAGDELGVSDFGQLRAGRGPETKWEIPDKMKARLVKGIIPEISTKIWTMEAAGCRLTR
jgi:hypothetical protein